MSQEDLVAGIQDVCWSPDSKSIYFSGMWHKKDYSDYHPGKWSIYKYDFNSLKVTKILDSAYTVSVSPDGKRLAVKLIVGGNNDVYVCNSDGSALKRLTNNLEGDFAPSWSPDGIHLVYNSRYNGKYEVYTTDGKTNKRITFSNGASAYNPVWSPDGKQIVYYLETGDGKDQIHVMNADGTNDMNITSDTLHNYFPGWTSDNRIVYTCDTKTGPSYAILIDRDGKNREQVPGIESFYTRLSPDRKMWAFIGRDGKIHIVNAGDSIEITTFSLSR